MSLIVAIEPDARQAAQLKALVRHRVGADLVHAPTTEQALAKLAKIGDRVPDLVLVPSLLSPQEDAALAGALRVIATVANVRMLTIPVLADPEQPPAHRTMFARWRARPKAVPGGCDPAVFAEQISDYLREAAAERQALMADVEQDALDSLLTAVAEEPTPDPVAEEPTPDPTPPFELEAPAGHPVELTPELELIAQHAGDLEAIRDLPFEFDEPPRIAQPQLELVAESQPVPLTIEEVAIDSATVDALIAPLLRDLEAAHGADDRSAGAPADEPAPVPDLDPLFFADQPVAPATRNETAWMELIASLRQDIERLKQEGTEPPPPNQVLTGVPRAAQPRTAPPRPRRQPRPMQDQWGLFDPDQCGFGALLAKLDEIVARDEAPIGR